MNHPADTLLEVYLRHYAIVVAGFPRADELEEWLDIAVFTPQIAQGVGGKYLVISRDLECGDHRRRLVRPGAGVRHEEVVP